MAKMDTVVSIFVEKQQKVLYHQGMKIYHGSKEQIKEPIYKGSDEHNDYGPAFYLTVDFESACIWATKNDSTGLVNVYNVNLDNLKVLDLTDKTKYSVLHWITILLEHRQLEHSFEVLNRGRINWLIKNYHVDIDEFDIVKGFRADDAYFRFPKEFVNGNISIELLEDVFKLGSLGIQYAFISEKAIKRLHFDRCIETKRQYIGVYYNQVKEATSLFDELLSKSIDSNEGTRIRDLMK